MAEIKEISIKVGLRIKYFRTLKKLSQESLALSAGLNPAFLGHIERGLKCPTIDTINKVALALNVPLPQLLSFDDESINSDDKNYERIKILLSGQPDNTVEKIANIIQEILNIKE